MPDSLWDTHIAHCSSESLLRRSRHSDVSGACAQRSWTATDEKHYPEISPSPHTQSGTTPNMRPLPTYSLNCDESSLRKRSPGIASPACEPSLPGTRRRLPYSLGLCNLKRTKEIISTGMSVCIAAISAKPVVLSSCVQTGEKMFSDHFAERMSWEQRGERTWNFNQCFLFFTHQGTNTDQYWWCQK